MRKASLICTAACLGLALALLTALLYARNEQALEAEVTPMVIESGSKASKPHDASLKSRRDRGIATLRIPRLELNDRITWYVNQGPAWWPVTGRPGGGDTIAIAGHRTTFSKPFYYLERLQPGDRIYVGWQGGEFVYRVTGRRILSAKNLHIADARGREVLLLSACTPRGSAAFRLVIYAQPEREAA